MRYSVLVTGAAGYLGGRVVGSLAARTDCEVRAGVRRHVAWLDPAAQVVVTPDGDIRDLVAALCGVQSVIHLAAPNEVAMASRPDESLADALTGARRMAVACRDAGVSRIVYASTIHVYGAAMAPGSLLTEDLLPAPRDHYALSRLASEYAISAFSSQVDVVVLRLTNIVGAPADSAVSRWSLLANDLCRQACSNGILRLRTDGAQWRDFVAMADACRVIQAAAGLVVGGLRPIPPGTYNAGSGRSMTVRALAGLVQDRWERRSGSRPALVAPEAPVHVPPAWHASIARLGALGFVPTPSLDTEIDETFDRCPDETTGRDAERVTWAT